MTNLLLDPEENELVPAVRPLFGVSWVPGRTNQSGCHQFQGGKGGPTLSEDHPSRAQEAARLACLYLQPEKEPRTPIHPPTHPLTLDSLWLCSSHPSWLNLGSDNLGSCLVDSRHPTLAPEFPRAVSRKWSLGVTDLEGVFRAPGVPKHSIPGGVGKATGMSPTVAEWLFLGSL